MTQSKVAKRNDGQVRRWNGAANALVGRTIVEARYLTAAECADLCWQRSTLVLVLDNGTTLLPVTDDEGNAAGALHVVDRDGNHLGMPVVPA